MSNVGQSIHGIYGYFAKGVSMGWPYYVCPVLVRVSMESADTLPRGIHGLAILCMSNISQSIHGIHGYFAKGVSMGRPYYVCPVLVRVSMESADTLPRGYPWVGHTMYVQCWSEYPWNLRILCQGGIHGLAILCMSNISQSIHGIRGYFAKGVSMGWPYYVCPVLVRVSMESTDTLPRGYPWVGHTMYVQHWSEYPWNPRILCQGGYPWVGHTMYVQCWSEYPWNPRILCQRVSMGWPYYVCPMLVRVSMESTDTLPKGVSMGWPYYVCPVLVRVSMESTDTLPRGYPWVGHTMYVQCWSEYPWNPRILCHGGIHGLAILCMSNVSQSISE